MGFRETRHILLGLILPQWLLSACLRQSPSVKLSNMMRISGTPSEIEDHWKPSGMLRIVVMSLKARLEYYLVNSNDSTYTGHLRLPVLDASKDSGLEDGMIHKPIELSLPPVISVTRSARNLTCEASARPSCAFHDAVHS